MSTARFHPQAWVNDYAMDVDPDGPTDWTLTPEYVAELEAANGWPLDRFDATQRDDLRNDPAAPEWVREWRGPFEVYIITERA